MRLAVIDCGTNTFNLLVVELAADGRRSKVFNTRIPVKLGEGSINKGYIGEAAFERAIEAFATFDGLIREHETEVVLAFATSAVRDAANGAELVSLARERFGFTIDVIDGQREAELIYLGIRDAVALDSQVSLIMDIGGGSTEFILANAHSIFWKYSFNIGAARLLQKFTPSDPITAQQEKNIEEYLDAELKPLEEAVKLHRPVELVGSSGAFESLVEMIHGEMGGEPLLEGKSEYDVDLGQHFKISRRVISSTLGQRRGINGLVPMRIDMIVISCLMVDLILKKFGLKRLRVSTYSLKEGALADFIAKRQG